MPNTARAIVDSALSEMARIGGVPISDILALILADPAGSAAVRFRAYVALGVGA